ncbi:hypothetical protein BC835DRAFT_1349643 [Cytidiella melzeri]|nr:hypothetical protein BC835DRAFT_1349643 [Cytidiella melzeri]
MSHSGYDTRYVASDPNSPAYTWAPEPTQITYNSPQMPSLTSYKSWSAGPQPELDATIMHSPPMTYQTPSPMFVSELTPDIAVAERSATAITLDEHCYATPENLPSRDTLKSARRVSRRPNPVAVPNLTKKARGRPVPTKDTLLKPGNGRAYACPVQECRKVFTRAEHLKRHTRSIHTNEKPFKCDELNCGRLFTRHDNLLQHLKNHRNSPSSRDVSADYGPLDRVHITHMSPEPDHSQVSPSMGVLIPPSISAMSISFSAQQQHEVADYRGDLSSDIGGVPSPGSSPGPSEPSYMTYTYGYAWPQSDIRSHPPATYAMMEPRYSHTTREQFISAAGAYAFHV